MMKFFDWNQLCVVLILFQSVLSVEFGPENSMYVKSTSNASVAFIFSQLRRSFIYMIPDSVISTSLFITRFHKKFEVESFYSFSQTYLTTGTHQYDSSVSDVLLLNKIEKTVNNMTDVSANPDINFIIPRKRPKKIVNCISYNYFGSPKVEIVNATGFINFLRDGLRSNYTEDEGVCSLVLFFSYSCPFCATLAPHYNALPRAFPQLRVLAMDSAVQSSINSQLGITSVPAMILFHNAKPIAKFNNSDYTLIDLTLFINKHTKLKANEKMYVASTDFGGPLPSIPVQEKDYFVYVSWIIVISFIISRLYNRYVGQLE